MGESIYYNNTDEESGYVKTPFASIKTIDELIKDSFFSKVKELITIEDIRLFHDQRIMPHYILNGEACYKFKDVEKWVRANILSFNEGKNMGIFYICKPEIEENPETIPEELAQYSEELREYNTHRKSVVYFLMDKVEIVYVGETGNIGARLKDHQKDKKFNRILFLNVPKKQRKKVEAKFISALLPKYNKEPSVIKLKKEKGIYIQGSNTFKDKIFNFLNLKQERGSNV